MCKWTRKNRKTGYCQACVKLENISCKGDNCILHFLCVEQSIYCIIFYLYCENRLSRNCYFVLLECVSVCQTLRSCDFELPLKCVNSTHCRFCIVFLIKHHVTESFVGRRKLHPLYEDNQCSISAFPSHHFVFGTDWIRTMVQNIYN